VCEPNTTCFIITVLELHVPYHSQIECRNLVLLWLTKQIPVVKGIGSQVLLGSIGFV